ncbi:MAG TPA: two-component regulator propeller domain-containing protein [Pyrinomonadaceae bacterium]|nr:two-component regulator propeller domain-containing protein [Pyrinomonadaceae bacterium]
MARFDGVQFSVFDSSNTKEIRGRFRTLYDDGNALWIGTYGDGLLSFEHGKVKLLTKEDGLSDNDVRVIYGRANGEMWIGTQDGVTTIKAGSQGGFDKRISLPGHIVSALCEVKDGSMWIGTDQGLYHSKDGKLTSYTTENGLVGNFVQSLLPDGDNGLWIGTNQGLSRFDKGRVEKFKQEPELFSGGVTSLLRDRAGSLWVGTTDGLVRLSNGSFSKYSRTAGLSDSFVRSIFEDREGNLWVGTQDGLNQLTDTPVTPYSTSEGLSNNFTMPIFESHDGAIWIGTLQGLNRLEGTTFVRFAGKEKLDRLPILSIYDDWRGNLWLGTPYGLRRLRNGQITTYSKKDGLCSNRINAITGGKDGDLWLGSLRCLTRMRGTKVVNYTTKNGLAGNSVSSIMMDSHDSVWIATLDGGISQFKDDRFINYSLKDGLPSNNIASVYEGSNGEYWIANVTKGLTRFKDGRFTTYTTKEGLFADFLHWVIEDDSGRIWASSDKGVFAINKGDFDELTVGRIPSLTSVAFGQTDGMRSSECIGLTQPGGYKTKDGKLWFPTVAGAISIDPNRVQSLRVPIQVHVEQVIADNKAIGGQQSVSLEAGTAQIEIRYTAPTFVAPERIRFKYRLEGFDADWIDAGSRRSAFYTSLPPGKYRFSVLASDERGTWPQSGAWMTIQLEPRFYQTYWFYALLIVSLILLAFGLHRTRLRSLQRRQEQLESLVANRTRALVDTTQQLEVSSKRQVDFVTGVSHELKTPLTLIRLYGETLMYGDESSPETRQEYYQIITRESERLTSLVNNVLDFSRLDRGLKNYSFREDNMATVVKETVQAHTHNLRRSGFTVELFVPSDLPPARFDRAAIIEVISNLLDNAAKYAGATKHISVRLRTEAKRIILEVEDQGVGIPKSEQMEVFQQFYRGSNVMDKGGYGLGLFLVKHIMDAHGGTIEVISDPGQMTKFTLSLPLDYRAPVQSSR